MRAMLGARGVDFWYEAGRPVLRGIDVEVLEGSITVVLGPNGAGKSTLLRILAGLARPRRGSVSLDGDDMGGLGPRALSKRIAFIPQHTSLVFAFTVRQFVRLGMHAMGGSPAHVESAARDVGIADRLDDPLAALSAGQRQRASFARALAQCRGMRGPGALVADEPTSAMDPRHAIESLDLLKRKADSGYAIVAALHDLTLAARYADRAILLTEDGRLAASGPARDVLDPARLERVFGLRFERLHGPSGEIALIPGRIG